MLSAGQRDFRKTVLNRARDSLRQASPERVLLRPETWCTSPDEHLGMPLIDYWESLQISPKVVNEKTHLLHSSVREMNTTYKELFTLPLTSAAQPSSTNTVLRLSQWKNASCSICYNVTGSAILSILLSQKHYFPITISLLPFANYTCLSFLQERKASVPRLLTLTGILTLSISLFANQ